MSEQWQEIPGADLAEHLIEQLSSLTIADSADDSESSSLVEHLTLPEQLSLSEQPVSAEQDESAIAETSTEQSLSNEQAALTEQVAATEPSPTTDTTAVKPPRILFFDRSLEEQAEAERVQAAYIKRVAHDPLRRQAVLEAILFAAAYPVSIEELARICEWPRAVVKSDLEELALTLEGRGLRLQTIAGECRLVTAADCSFWVERYLQVQNRVKLSRPQLETLAIVAYNQPVTRAVIDTYRGVRSERVLNQLEDLRLIRETGRAELPGRPILYGTTKEFLQYFALNSIEELPQLFPAAKAGVTKRDDDARGDEALNLATPAAEYDALDKPSEGLQALLARMRRKQDREDRRAEASRNGERRRANKNGVAPEATEDNNT